MAANFHLQTVQTDQDFKRFLALNLNAMIAYGFIAPDASQTEIEKQYQEVHQYIKTKEKNMILLATPKSPSLPAAGFIWAAERDGREPWYFGEQPAWIYNIWVEPAFRRQGLATLLMDACREWAETEGFARLGLHVFGTNQAAIKLYERTGFKVGHQYLQKKLNESPDTPRTHERNIVHGYDENTLKAVRAGTFICFQQQACQNGRPNADEIQTRFDQWYANFDFSRPKMQLFSMTQNGQDTAGFLWGHLSKGDLGDQAYFWLQGLYTAQKKAPESILQALLLELESWMKKEDITIIRTNVQFPPAVRVFEQNGFFPGNLFMIQDLS